MGYHGNSKILLPWGVPIHRVFYSAKTASSCGSVHVVQSFIKGQKIIEKLADLEFCDCHIIMHNYVDYGRCKMA